MSIQGLVVSLTGRLDGLTRAEFKELLSQHGATYSARIDDAVDLVVVGDGALASKVAAARSHGVQVVEQRALNARLLEVDTPPVVEVEDVPLDLPSIDDAPTPLADLPDGVRVVDVLIPRAVSGPMTPSMSGFLHYCLDGRTLEMMRFVARAICLAHPCLLEGDTATSKTSVIQYLAARTGHQLVRLNVNGQSDTAELVGRYVPADEGGWRFQEGLVPLAMRHGWWVILDEVNLAEPAVLERLNSVLERAPSLVLTEGPGTRFGAQGDVPVHPNFRIFATMNPAEYQGRSVLSPAYRDRWVATYQASSPGELEYRQMLERLVFARQPNVVIGGRAYRGMQTDDAPHDAIAGVTGVAGLLSRLAALHAGLVSMASSGDGRSASLGASRRESYVFSRRGLLAVLDGLSRSVLCDPNTGVCHGFTTAPQVVAADTIYRVYVDRIRDEDDRTKVLNLLDTLGLRRETWAVRLGT